MVTIRVVTTRWNSSGVRSPGLSVPLYNGYTNVHYLYIYFKVDTYFCIFGLLGIQITILLDNSIYC